MNLLSPKLSVCSSWPSLWVTVDCSLLGSSCRYIRMMRILRRTARASVHLQAKPERMMIPRAQLRLLDLQKGFLGTTVF